MPDSPEEKLAANVSQKVSQHLLDEAYSLLKDGVQANFADKNAEEKNSAWKVISDKLSQDGSLSKLSAPFLKDVGGQVDRNHDGMIQKDELSPVAQNSKNPFYRGMAAESLKSFDIAASLGCDDKAIDRFELSSFAKRQFMAPRKDFVDSLIANVENKVKENPAEAMNQLQDSLSIRGGMETLSERLETWQQAADQLSSHHLASKLSMAFLTRNQDIFDTDKNNQFSRAEISKFETSRSPIMREFTRYIGAQFDKISTVDYDGDQISKKEQAIYERKMFQQ
jgi:hypothetical protein